jgi:hypothetical protein
VHRDPGRAADPDILVAAQASGGHHDIDNYAKAALDAINNIVVVDGAQVVELRAIKKYGVNPKLVATVYPLTAALSEPDAGVTFTQAQQQRKI